MPSFQELRQGTATLAGWGATLRVEDLAELTNEMIDLQLAILDGVTDADVVFVPQDPDAHDPYAAAAEDEDLAWTLGHVVVHVTASSEEAAFLAAEMARGVDREGRSRYETPWETVHTVQQCRDRLEESRRMRMGTLAAWPDEPDLTVVREYGRMDTPANAVVRFIMGLLHDDGHLEQMKEIARQARIARAER